MPTATFYLSGTAKWAKLKKPDPKYKRWTIDLYLDEASKAVFAESGMQLARKTNEDGTSYHTFGRAEQKLIKNELVNFDPPTVIDAEGNPFDKNVGNGSHVTIKVSVYDTVKGKGHRLDVVRVNRLVPYEGGSEMPPVPVEATAPMVAVPVTAPASSHAAPF